MKLFVLKAKQYKKEAYSIFIVLMIILSGVFANVFVGMSLKNNNKQAKIYQYNINKNVDYQVNLIDNKFIQGTTETNNLNIAKLVNSISSNFSYRFTGNQDANIKYNYDVTATISSVYKSSIDTENGGNQVWSKSYVLVPSTENNVSDKSFNIDVNVPIDYNKYQNIVRDFVQELGLSVDSKLKISMNLRISGITKNGERFNKNDVITMSMPLGKDVFQVTNDQNIELQESIVNDSKAKATMIDTYFMLGIACLFISIIFTVLFGIDVLHFVHKSKYHVELNKILNDYGEIIVEVVNPIPTDNKQIIRVKNFNELIDLEQELRIPILCYINELKAITTFAILNNNQIYQYILKEELQSRTKND